MALPAGAVTTPPAKIGSANAKLSGATRTVSRAVPKRATTANRRMLASAAAGGGTPNDAVAPNPYQQQAQAQIDPIIAAITAAATGQANAADQAIQGLTDSYAKGIGSIDYGSPYSGAEAQQAAVDAALQQSATGQGSDLAAALAQRLQALQGSSGANAVNQEAASLASQGSGIGGAQLASGSAALNQLISDAAAAKSYGQKMPGVIDSAGLQGIEQAQGQAQQAINQGTLQAESQLPQIEQNLKANALQAKATKADAQYKKMEIALRAQSLAQEGQYRKAEIMLRQAGLQQGQQRLGIEQQRLNIEAQRAVDSSKQAWARIGIADKRLQIEATKSSIAARNGGLSASAVSRYRSIADSWAQRMTGSTTDPNTMVKDANGNLVPKQLPQLSFKDAMTQAMKAGVPLSIAFPQFIKVFKQAGGTPDQIRALQKEYKPLDNAIKIAAKQAAKDSFSPFQTGSDGLIGMTGGAAPFG